MQRFKALAMASSLMKFTTRGVKPVHIISRTIQSNPNSQYNVRGATKDDFDQLWNLIQSQEPSWPTDPHFIKTALEVFPGRIVIAEDMKRKSIVGMGSCIPANDEHVIACLFIVHEDSRGQGLGQQIIIEQQKRIGDVNVLGDSVPNMTEMYEKIGFKKFCGVSFWNGKICQDTLRQYDGNRKIDVTEATKSSISEIIKYDKTIYPLCREWFIKRCVFEKPGIRVKIAVENEEVVGYGFIIPPSNNFYMSSLYANDADIARRIFSSAILDLPDGAELTLCIPDDNTPSSSMATEIGLKRVKKLTKMATKKPIPFPSSQVFFTTQQVVLY